MSKKLIPVALTILSGTALAWAAACSSTPASNGKGGGSSSSSSSGGSGSGSSSSGGGSSSGGSSSGGSGSSSGGSHDGGIDAGPCVGTAGSLTIIDNQSAATGTGITLPAPTGGMAVGGSWFDYAATGGTIANPPSAPANPAPPMTFSPAPAGIPAEAGATETADGGAPRAACIAGETGTAAYSTEGMGFNLAVTPNPDGGAGTPSPINASCHTGIQFWAWGGLDAGMQSVIMNVPDRNETPGLGVCDPTNTGLTACGGATKTVTIGPGWQLIQVPFALFADNQYYGGSNETALDPTSSTQIQWQVQLVSPDGGAPVPFDFCVSDVAFY